MKKTEQSTRKHFPLDDLFSPPLDLREIIFVLSDALDLVGIDEHQHGKRVAFMAVTIARALRVDEGVISKILYAALLHDCGVSSTSTHQRLVNELEWDHAEVHCKVGYNLLRNFPPLAHLAPAVFHHHSRWEDIEKEQPLSDEDALVANLIFLADRVDSLAAPFLQSDILDAREHVLTTFANLEGQLFEPRLLDCFIEVSQGEAFWLALDPAHILNFLWCEEKKLPPLPIGLFEFKEVARIFAAIVDAKSQFTQTHSKGVAALARHLGETLHLSFKTCEKLEIAGLLHDLGKLQVPDHILEKPGDLTEQERKIINRHSFQSFQLLNRIAGIEDIAMWAAYHHETPGGNGYPFRVKESALSLEARIIATADIFQALAQERPYRKASTPEEIIAIMLGLAKQQRLDRQLVELIASDLENCWCIALESESRRPAMAG